MKFLNVVTTATLLAGSANADLVYSSSSITKVDGVSAVLPGTTAIAGNVPRTIMLEARVPNNAAREPFNFFECGYVAPNENYGRTFAAGRWYGTHGTTDLGLTCHTWGGCYNDDVGEFGKPVPVDDKWHNIAHTWDGTTHKLYWDGELYAEGTDNNGTLDTFANGCKLGGVDPRFRFNGDINNVEIWTEVKDAEYVKAAYENQAKKKIYWEVSNRGSTGWRPSVGSLLAYANADCTDRVEVHHVGDSGSNNNQPATLLFDDDDSTRWRPACHPCRKGEAYVRFTSSEEIRCVVINNLGEGSTNHDDTTWNGGVNLLRNGVNHVVASGQGSEGNKVTFSGDYSPKSANGLCDRSPGVCTGSNLTSTALGSVIGEEECLEKCVSEGNYSGCEAQYNVATKMIDCFGVSGSVDAADNSSDNSCFVLKDCVFPLDNMRAWFRGEDAQPGAWASKVNDFSVHVYSGTMGAFEGASGGSEAYVSGISGNVSTRVNFADIAGPATQTNEDYTICTASRYVLGGQQRRIITSFAPTNWLIGQHGGFAGVAYSAAWLTHKTVANGSENNLKWFVTCVTNNSNKVVANGIEVGIPQVVNASIPRDLNINRFSNEQSSFQVAEVLTWTRQFSEEEMTKVSNYIFEKLNQGEYKTPSLIKASSKAAANGLTCGSVPEVKFERLWSNIDSRTQVDLQEGKVAFEVTGDGPGITILIVDSNNLVENSDGALTEDTEGLELFIGGSIEPVIHVSDCLGCAPREDSIRPIVDDIIKPEQFTDVFVTVSGKTISINTGKIDGSNVEVYSYTVEADIVGDQAIFSYGYNDMECA